MTPRKSRIHSFTDDVLTDLDAVGLSELIKKKELAPKEVIAASIERVKKIEPHLNAVVTNRYEEQLQSAHDQNTGFFSGIPTYIKDLTYVKGTSTYFGSDALANTKPAKKSDPIAKQLFAQGFVHLGNSKMSEFGFTCSTEFENKKDTRNPWNINHTPGGSSGGSAALVASGVVPLAHAADGGGSIRIPAASCGLVGLKPSRGRLLKSKLFKGQIVDIAIDGVITRSVRDTAYFYGEAEKYYQNSKLPAIGLIEGASKKTYTIGYTGDSINSMGADKTSKEELNKTVKLLESLGHTVKLAELNIPNKFVEDFASLWAMNAFFCSRFGKMMFNASFEADKISNLTRGLSKSYLEKISKTPSFVKRLRKTYHDYSKMFTDQKVDLFLTPTVASSAPKIGYFGMDMDFEELFDRIVNWTCFTPYSNASGGPSISLPLGFDKVNDLPIGMMFWANHGQEKLLLDIAYQLEEALGWRKITEN